MQQLPKRDLKWFLAMRIRDSIWKEVFQIRGVHSRESVYSLEILMQRREVAHTFRGIFVFSEEKSSFRGRRWSGNMESQNIYFPKQKLIKSRGRVLHLSQQADTKLIRLMSVFVSCMNGFASLFPKIEMGSSTLSSFTCSQMV